MVPPGFAVRHAWAQVSSVHDCAHRTMPLHAAFALHVAPSVQHDVVMHVLHVGLVEPNPPHAPPSVVVAVIVVGVFAAGVPLLLEHATMIAPSPTRTPNFDAVFRTLGPFPWSAVLDAIGKVAQFLWRPPAYPMAAECPNRKSSPALRRVGARSRALVRPCRASASAHTTRRFPTTRDKTSRARVVVRPLCRGTPIMQRWAVIRRSRRAARRTTTGR